MVDSKALRFLLLRTLGASRQKRRSNAKTTVSVTLPMAGVAIGVCFFTVVLSIMGGFVSGLKTRLLGLEPHIEIIRKDDFGRVAESEDLVTRLKSQSRDIVEVTPFLKGDAIVQSNSRPQAVTLVGIDPERARRTSNLESHTRDHDLRILNEPQQVFGMVPSAKFPPVILGREVANFLGVDIGDRVTLISTVPEEGPAGLAPAQLPMVVADIFSSGSPAYDAKWAVVSLPTAQSFFGTEHEWAGLQVRIKEPLDVEALIPKLDAFLAPMNLRAKPWTESNHALLRALKLEKWGMSFVIGMIILVGCFSISITLILAVKRKAREMAILRSLGLARRDLGLLLVLQGVLIGVSGIIFGLAIGFGILFVLGHVPLPILSQNYNGRPLPVLINWNDIGAVCIGSVALSVLASLWPASAVMRIDVIETLADRT